MQKHNKSLLTMMIVIIFLFTNTIFAFAQPSDIEGHWAKDVIEKWANYEIVKGSEGLYKPNSNITRAEFVVMVSRVLKPIAKGDTGFSDVSDKQWFSEDVLKAVEAGFIQGDGKGSFKPAADITRQEAAVVLYKAFDMKPGNTSMLNLYKDYKEVADWAKDAVAALVENGYMSGKPGNILAPKDSINRAETVNLINNIAGELKHKAGTYTGDVEGSLVINTADVVLKDMAIKGNLYIAHGVGEGNVDLDNVTVMGKTIIRGGGENSIRIKNSNLNGTLVVLKKNGKVRIVAIENTSIENVELAGSAKLTQESLKGTGYGNVTIIPLAAGAEIVIEGDIKELKVEAPQTEIKVLDGTVAKFTVADTAANTAVEVAKEAVVKTLTVQAKADITGTGTIEKTDIKAEEVKIDDKLTTPETPATTPTTGGGGGSTGGGSKDDDDDDTPSYVLLTGVQLNVGGSLKAALGNDGKNYTIELGTYANTAKITGIKMTAPTGAKLTVTSVVSADNTNVTMNKEFTLPKEIAVTELLSGNSDVSLSSMRALFGSNVTVRGTLSCTGYSSSAVSFKMNLGTSDGANIPNDWVTVTTSNTKITATIKPGKGTTTLASIGIATFLEETVGELPEQVTIGSTVCNSTDIDYHEKIKEALTSVTGNASWSEVTLSNLVGKSIKFKKSGDTSIYIVEVTQ